MQSLLTPIGTDPSRIRTSLYGDDAEVFIRPTSHDLANLQLILDFFGEATGLKTNIQKTELYKIRCDELDLDNVLTRFGGQISCFPCKYLGLPLQIGRPRRADEQIIVDKIGARLPGWKGTLLSRAGRVQLVQSVLSSIPTYPMTVFPLLKWAIKKIDRIRRNFLRKGSDDARGGHCLVNWKWACRSKALGGLGIRKLQEFNRALRLRWLCLKWKEPIRPWTGFKIQNTHAETELFRSCTSISIGDGSQANFWHDK